MDSNERISKLEVVVSEILIDTHLIKEDLKGVKTDLQGVKADLNEVKEDLNEVKEDLNEVKEDLNEVKEDLRGVRETMTVKFDLADKRMDSFQSAFNRFGEAIIDKFAEIAADLKQIKNGYEPLLKDHERRIRLLERK